MSLAQIFNAIWTFPLPMDWILGIGLVAFAVVFIVLCLPNVVDMWEARRRAPDK